MPPKRKGKPKKKPTEKKKSSLLFDFLDDIMVSKTNILCAENEHGYSRYMITKFLSMHQPYVPLVDVYLNKFSGSLGNAEFHKLCIALIPKRKIYLKYIGGKGDINECRDKLKCIIDYFKVSEQQAFEYYQIAGDELVVNIKKMYGTIE